MYNKKIDEVIKNLEISISGINSLLEEVEQEDFKKLDNNKELILNIIFYIQSLKKY